MLSGAPTATASAASFTIKVTDSASNSASGTYSVTVDAGVKISPSGGALPAGYVNAPYSTTLTASGGAGTGYTWSATGLPSWLSIAPATGVLSGTPAVAASAASFTVKVTDSLGNAATGSYSVTVDATLTIATTSPLPTGVVSTNYSDQLHASGGMGSYSWTVTAGATGSNSLQSVGLSLSSAGVLSGATSTLVAGTATFTVQVEDTASHTQTATFTVTINASLYVKTTSLPNAFTGTAYAQTLQASGGTGGNSWSVTSNLSGLTALGLSLSTGGVLSGSASGLVAGSATFTVQVEDSSSDKATQTLTIDVYHPLTLPASGALSAATTNQLYSGAVNASGGSGSGYVFTVNGVPIPTNGSAVLISDSISVSNTGGNTLSIGGTPTTTGTVTLTNVTVKDGAGDTAGPGTYTIAVNPPTPLTLPASGALSAATTNQLYNGAVNASGGSGSGYVFTVNGAQIPTNGSAVLISDSISVSNNGGKTLSISGTPTLTQTVTLTNVTVKDGAGDTAGPDTYTIAVNPPTPLTLPASGALSAATTSQLYNGAVNASGGSGSNYVFSINGVAVPTNGSAVLISDGISVSNNGGKTLSIGGTPPTSGTVTLTNVTVKDGAGDTAGPDTYTIAVSPATPLTLPGNNPNPGSLPNGTVNQQYNGSINASGGSGSGVVFSINGAAVPTNGSAVLISNGISVSNTGGNTLSINGTPPRRAHRDPDQRHRQGRRGRFRRPGNL